MVATSVTQAIPAFSAKIVHTDAELRGLAPMWKELFRRVHCDNPFLSFDWMSQWWIHFGHGWQLFVVTVTGDDDRLIALAPLYISPQAGPMRIRRLGFLGDRFVGSDHLDFLVEKGDVSSAVGRISDLILRCRDRWDYIEMSDLREDSIALQIFTHEMTGKGMTSRRAPSSSCPYLRLPDSMEDYVARLKPKFRKNLRHYARALQREGHVDFVSVEGRPDIDGAFSDLLKLHRARFAERNRRSAFLEPKIEAFHRAVLRSLSESGNASIHFVELQGKRIAGLYGFSFGRKFSYYQSGLDPAYGRLSIGTLIVGSAIEAAIRSSHNEFDFLRGSEAYKRLWTDEERRQSTATFFDGRGRSRLARITWLLRQSLRNGKAALSQLYFRGVDKTRRRSTVPNGTRS